MDVSAITRRRDFFLIRRLEQDMTNLFFSFPYVLIDAQSLKWRECCSPVEPESLMIAFYPCWRSACSWTLDKSSWLLYSERQVSSVFFKKKKKKKNPRHLVTPISSFSFMHVLSGDMC
jgi:hypothetical protein